MKILVTGAKGFIAKNLIAELKNQKYDVIYEFDLDSSFNDLDLFTKDCDFVFHLAGVNRPENKSEFMKSNFGFTDILLDSLKKHNNKCPIMISSSVQAKLNNPYGLSKKAGEDLIFNYKKSTGASVFIYRFPNVFGKWCRPNYNSAVATFSNNIANSLPVKVNDPNIIMSLIYIDDLVVELINALKGNENIRDDYCYVEPVYTIMLGEIAELLYLFKSSRESLLLPNMGDEFTKKLYATYLSYLPKNDFSYDLNMNVDSRGSFTEFLKTDGNGQISINISKPGITKGNHWHHTKNEKFLVVSGKGVIKFRRILSEEVIKYFVSGNNLEVIDIPVGYTHNIENLGITDMVTVMWANEVYDSKNPDTIYEEV